MTSKITAQEECFRCKGILDISEESAEKWSSCRTCGDSMLTKKDTSPLYFKGFGVLNIVMNNGSLQCSSFTAMPNESNICELIDILQDENVDTKQSYLTIMKDDKVVLLFGTMPPAYANIYSDDEVFTLASGQ